MKHLGKMHISLLILALINMAPAVEVEDSWGIFAMAVVCALGSCLWFHRAGPRTPPRWIIYLGVVGATAFLVYEMFFPQEEQTVHIIDLSHFIILLCCCKFFDFQTHRDAGLIALISFLLIVISAFVTASPLFAAAVFVDVTFGLAWLLHFHAEREAAAVEKRQKGGASILQAALAPRLATPVELSGAGIKRTVLVCSILLAGFASVVFVFAPRGWRGGLFSRMQGLVPASVTGFSDVIELTDDPIIADEATIMRVRFSVGGRLITDEAFQPYMRGLTFDQYFRGRWQHAPTAHPRVLAGATTETPLPIVDLRQQIEMEKLIRQDVWLESMNTSAIFTMYPPLHIGSLDIGRVTVDRRDLALEAATTSRKSVHYTVWSAADSIMPYIKSSSWRGGPRGENRSIISDRVRELAESLVPTGRRASDTGAHEAIARAIRDYLVSDRFEYTLNRGGGRREADPILNFLFESRRGHCEYFASAMTLMCQALDMPARLVTGYHGGELNQVGGFHQFRKRDAHAWVEVWLPDVGWTIFDPTPPSAVEGRRSRPSLWADMLRLVDYLRFSWSTSIVSFDAKNKEELVRGLTAWFSAIVSGEGDDSKSIGGVFAELLWGPEFFVLWQRLLYWLLIVLCVVLALLALRVAWILSLMLREYVPGGKRLGRPIVRPADARFFDRMLLLLADKGHVKPPHATPREFATRLARANDDLVEMPEFIDWFYETQYGRRALGRQRAARVRRFLRKLREDPSFGAA